MATLTIKNNKGTVTLGTYQTQSYGLDLTVTSEGATIYDGSTYYYFKYAGAGTYRGLALRTYETEPAAGVGIGELYHMDASATSVTFYVAEAEADIIRIDVKGKVAVVRGTACIVCGNSDYLMRFSFDEAWDAHNEKTARFVYRKLDGVHHFDKPFTGTDLFVPKLSGVDSVLVGVYAGDLVTTTPATIPCKRSILCDSGTVEGAMVPSQYEELLAKYTALVYAQEELVVRVDAHEKRIVNLEKGLSDDRFVTDDSLAYVKNVPVNACPFAAVEKVGGMTKKSDNLIPFPYYYPSNGSNPSEVQGVTFTCNEDGTITVNGTSVYATAFNWQLGGHMSLTPGKYFLSGCPIGGHSSTYKLFAHVTRANGTSAYPNDFGTGTSFELYDGDTMMILISIGAGATLNNVVFKPMLNAGNSALPYERYHEGVRSAKLTSIESKDASGNIIGRIDIPTEVQNLEGYGEGAGMASNGIVWSEYGVFHEKRCKKINLTADKAIYRDAYAPNYRFGFNIEDKAPSAGFIGNMASNIAVKPDPVTTPAAATEYSIAGMNGSGAVYVIIPNCASASDAIAYLNAHPIELWYETTDPETIDISDLITKDNLIEVEGGGTLTFVNEHGAAASSTITYQVKGET